jgi:hypothetical protein
MNLNIGGAPYRLVLRGLCVDPLPGSTVEAVDAPAGTQTGLRALPWVFDDGGRSTYFVGSSGDCVTRAIAVAAGLDYRDVYDALADGMARMKPGRGNRGKRSARNGVASAVYRPFLVRLGWEWHPTMSIGSGCRVHLAADEIPMSGRVIVRCSRHLTAVVDGVIHDTHDPSRAGTRCVYGYYTEPGTDCG